MTTIEVRSAEVLHDGEVDPTASPLVVGPVELTGTSEHQPPGRLRSAGRGVARPFTALRAVPNLPVVVGMLLVVAGGILLLVAWGRTAGLVNVALQMPYVVSAGCTGLGLVAIGLTVVSIAAKARDAAARQEQLAELQSVLAALRAEVEGDRL